MPTFAPHLRALAATATLVVALAACSTAEETTPPTPQSSQTPESTGSPSGTPPPASTTPNQVPTQDDPDEDGQLLAITIAGDAVQPNAEEYDLARGEKLLIAIDSDRAGELHVHSTPEQFIEFDAGTTDAELVIDTPGSVEVEDHDTSAVVALIEVR